MKIAILTSLCGDREKLCNPVVIHDNVDYFAFVDNPKSGLVWNQQKALEFTTDKKYKNRRNAKIYKILPFLFAPGYDYYFWVDVSHDVVENPFKIIEKHMDGYTFGFFKHTARNCVYDEAKILLELGYDFPENINNQINFYKEEQYPTNNGLFELSTFITKNTPDMQTTCLMWWEQICKFASRDQLSLPFCLWKNKMQNTVSVLPGFANGYNSRGSIGNNPLMPQTRIHAGA